jgi:hypothetical protein
VRNLTLEQHLFEIAQRRRHTLHALAKLDEMVFDELLSKTSLQKPRQKVPHIPSIEANLRDVVVPE